MPLSGPETRDTTSAVRRVLIGLLGANLVVVAAKLYIGVVSGSLAVLGDALHSSVDSLYNVLGLIVIRVAARAPDEDHPYGHGKFETLGALAIVVFLSITCFELVRNRRERDRELLREVARRAVALGQELEDAAASGVGEGAEQGVMHG